MSRERKPDAGPQARQGQVSRGRPPLSRDAVVRAALAIVDRDGLDSFSMRKLGAELGVDPMAAYYYFPNKAAVLDGIVDAVQSEIAPLSDDNDAPWDVRLRKTMHAWRRVLRAHPHALPVLSTHPPFSDSSLRQWEAAAEILHAVGFTPVEALQAIGCISGYVIGVTLAEVGQQPGDLPDPTLEEVAAHIAQLPSNEFPILKAAFLGGMPDGPDTSFDDGLDLFIAGLKARQGKSARGAA
jgi:AcrR family transcriptional regulator